MLDTTLILLVHVAEARTFEETDGYDEVVLLKDIRLESHC